MDVFWWESGFSEGGNELDREDATGDMVRYYICCESFALILVERIRGAYRDRGRQGKVGTIILFG